MKRNFRWLFVATAVVLAIVAGTGQAQAADKSNTKILGGGSDATYYLNTDLAQLYNESPGCRQIAVPPEIQPLDFTCLSDIPGVTLKTENYARDVVSVAPPIGGNFGIQQLCGNLAGITYATSPRAPRIGQDCTGLHFSAFARDGIAWECFGGCHGVTSLTKAQLQGIYGNCSITDWSQVGGTPGPIKVYAVNPGAGVRSNWLSYLGLSTDATCTPDAAHIIRQNSNTQILAIGDQADAIFYTAISAWQVRSQGDGSSIRALEGVAPIEANIINSTYPLGYFASNVYCAASVGASPCPKPASKGLKNFVHETTGWICKASPGGDHKAKHSNHPFTDVNYRTEIENTIRDNGFVPLPYGLTGGSASGSSFCREFDS